MGGGRAGSLLAAAFDGALTGEPSLARPVLRLAGAVKWAGVWVEAQGHSVYTDIFRLRLALSMHTSDTPDPPHLPAAEPGAPAANDAWRRVAEKVAGQHWPSATLYVVATPIGNLGDLGLRAWQVLVRATIIAAEDTRATRTLLDAWGVDTPLMAAHRHNEAAAAQSICERLAKGETVALVSDAGAPAVSDPGARIVRAVREAGWRVVPIPGASAVIAALMASGVTTDANPAYVFAGFAPPKSAARRRWLTDWSAVAAPVVMFESPKRVAACLQDMRAVCGDAREVTVARELTKRFEAVDTLALGDAQAWLNADTHREQGEFVLILHAPPPAADTGIPDDALAWLTALVEVVSVRDAARVVAKVTGLPRDVLYAQALMLKNNPDASDA